MAKAEQQLTKAERKLKGIKNDGREWFQTKKQREEEKERLSINSKETLKGGKVENNNKRKTFGSNNDSNESDEEPTKKKKKKQKEEKPKSPEQLAKERAMKELEKVSLVQAKLAKIKKRPGRLNAVNDNINSKQIIGGGIGGKKKKSKFATDLTDVGRNNAKRLR